MFLAAWSNNYTSFEKHLRGSFLFVCLLDCFLICILLAFLYCCCIICPLFSPFQISNVITLSSDVICLYMYTENKHIKYILDWNLYFTYKLTFGWNERSSQHHCITQAMCCIFCQIVGRPDVPHIQKSNSVRTVYTRHTTIFQKQL